MKWYRLLLPALLLASVVRGQSPYCTPDLRFTETPCFSVQQITSQQDLLYGTALNRLGKQEALLLDIYFPKLSVDPLPKRPLVVLIHGGGFAGGDKNDMGDLCAAFAMRGFVAATLNYRLGHACATDSLAYDKAVYRAIQDARAAMRYLATYADTLRIDTAWMFAGGGSAGAGTAMMLHYCTQQDADIYEPRLAQSLGSLDSSGNTFSAPYRFRALFNNWGAIRPSWVTPPEMIPMISFHGDADGTVPVDSGPDNGCRLAPGLVYGSRALHSLLLAHDVCSDLTIKPGGGHGIYTDNAAAKEFRVAKAACFFKSVMCETCSSFATEDSVAAICSSPTGETAPVDEPWITAYPNPAAGTLFLQFRQQKEGVYTLFNATGQMVRQGVLAPVLPLDGLPTGLYWLVITGGEGQTVAIRVMVE